MTLRQRVGSMSDKALDRILRIAIAALVIGVVAFGAVYYAGQHVNKTASLASRQVSSAEKAVRAMPGDVQARLRLAAAYQSVKRYDDALAQYDEILKAKPDQRSALLGRGDVLMTKGNLKDAKATLRKITDVAVTGEFAGADTQLEQAFYFLGSIAVREGAPSEAVTNLESAVRIQRTDADAWYLLGVARLAQGQAAPAVDAIRRALLFVPIGWCEPYTPLSDAYRKLGNAPEAEYAGAMLDFCQKRADAATTRLTTLLAGPAAVDAMLGLGMIAEQASDRDTAIGWYEKVLARDAKNVAARYALSALKGNPVGSSTSKPSSHPTSGQEGS